MARELRPRDRQPAVRFLIDPRRRRRRCCPVAGRTAAAEELIAFELDHYDVHSIPRKSAEADPFVWRVGLLGGGRLRQLAERFRKMPTLAEVVASNEWEYGEGFIVGKKSRPLRAPH